MHAYLRSQKSTTTVSPNMYDDDYYEDYTTTTRSRRRRTTTVSPVYYDDDYESPAPPTQVQKNTTAQNNTQTIEATTQTQHQNTTIDQDTSSIQEIMDPDQWSPYEEQPVSSDSDYDNDTELQASTKRFASFMPQNFHTRRYRGKAYFHKTTTTTPPTTPMVTTTQPPITKRIPTTQKPKKVLFLDPTAWYEKYVQLGKWFSNYANEPEYSNTNDHENSRVKRQAQKNMFTEAYSAYPVNRAYIPIKTHIFRKALPFKQIFEEITSLQFNLKYMSPSNEDPSMSTIRGVSKDFIMMNFPRNMVQNTLTCAEKEGTLIDIKTLLKEQIAINSRVMTNDLISIEDNAQLDCNLYATKYQNIACVEKLKLVASTMGLYFTNQTATEYLRNIVRNSASNNLVLVIDKDKLSLEASPVAKAVCDTATAVPADKRDKLTISFQNKFFSHLNNIYTQILEAYYQTTINTQHMFQLLIGSKLPGPGSPKPIADICKAAKQLIPVPIAVSQTPLQQNFQGFIDTNKQSTLAATKGFAAIRKSLVSLCEEKINEPSIMTIYHGLTSMNLNVQTHLSTYHKHMRSPTTLSLPSPMPLLLSESTTAGDVQQGYANMLHTILTEEHSMFLFTLVENEKVNTLIWLKPFLPTDLALPAPIHFSEHYGYLPSKFKPSKLFTPHTEFRNAPSYSQEPVISLAGYANDQPQLAAVTPQQITLNGAATPPQTAAIITNDIPASDAEQTTIQPPQETNEIPTDQSIGSTVSQPQIESNDIPQLSLDETNPSHEQTNSDFTDLNTVHTPERAPRQKRHWFADLMADVTGLATSEDLQKLDDNEQALQRMEERTQQELETVLTKTNSIVSSLTDQAAKMAQLYADEADVKMALQRVLDDERSALNKLAKLAASIEIFSDIVIEYEALTGLISLIPHMLEETEQGIMAVADQSIFPSLLPAENIKQKIPQQTKTSMMTPIVNAYQTPKDAYIEFKLSEYAPAFNIYKIDTLPLISSTNNSYTGPYLVFNLATNLVGQNGLQETFLYQPGQCPERRGYIICSPHQVKIHRKPTTCEEVLVAVDTTNWNLCTEPVQFGPVTTQSFIFRNSLSKIRIFTPYNDTISTMCGGNFTKDIANISIGYSDISTKSTCTIYTKELKIVSPIPPSDEMDVTISFSIPDLSQAMDDLIRDIELTHELNFTVLQNDLAILMTNISAERKSIKAVQTSLQHIKTIKEIDDFDLMHVDLKTIHTPSTKMKVGFWVSFGLSIILLLSCLYLCCPAVILRLITSTFSILFGCVHWMFRSCWKYGKQCCKFPRQPGPVILNRNIPPVDIYPNEQLDRFWENVPLDDTPRRPLNELENARRDIMRFRAMQDDIEQAILNPQPSTSPKGTERRVAPPPPYEQENSILNHSYVPPTAPTTVPNKHLAALYLPVTDQDFDWSIKHIDAYRCILMKQVDGINRYYVPATKAVHVSTGLRSDSTNPPEAIVTQYLAKFYNLRPMTLTEFKADNGSSWEMDDTMQAFFRNINGKLSYRYGYRPVRQ